MLLNPFLLERAFLLALKNIPPESGEKMRKRRSNALKKACERLIENPYINYESGKLLILSDTLTETGEAKFYRTSREECRLIDPVNFPCQAFWEGFPCWHRATLEIVEQYFLLERELKPEINRQNVARVNNPDVVGVNTLEGSEFVADYAL